MIIPHDASYESIKISTKNFELIKLNKDYEINNLQTPMSNHYFI